MAASSSTYDVVISFSSLGAGIDQTVHAKLRAYVERLGRKISCQSVPWGMEGEIDYCINFNDLSDSDRVDIHNALADICGEAPLVTIALNAACSHLN